MAGHSKAGSPPAKKPAGSTKSPDNSQTIQPKFRPSTTPARAEVKKIKIMLDRLYLFYHENQQPADLKKKLPADGSTSENIRYRVFAAGATMATINFSLNNYERVDADFIDSNKDVLEILLKTPPAKVEKAILDYFNKEVESYLKQDYFAKVKETFAPPARAKWSSVPQNRVALNAYLNDFHTGWNTEVKELKEVFPEATYYPSEYAVEAGDALKLVKAVVDSL